MQTKAQSRNLCVASIATAACAVLNISTASADDYSSAILADNPIGYYRLGDVPAALPTARNSGSLGVAGNAAHINATRGVGGALAGSANGSAYYDGTGARTAIAFTPVLNPPAAQSFTIEAWVKPTIDGLGNAQAPLFNRHSSGNRQGWVFFQRSFLAGFNFRMYNENGGSQSVDITGGAYTVGEWTHLALAWDGPASTATLYVNGVNVASQTAGYVANTDAPMTVGAYGANNPGDNPYTGYVDEVAWYSNALSPSQILAHYDNGTNGARTVAYESLVAGDGAVEYLRLNEPNAINSGSLGAKADGTHTIGVKLGATGALAGNANTSATYVGIQDADGGSPTTLPFDAGLNPSGSFTVEAWVKPTVNGFGNAQCPLHNRASTSPNGNGNRSGWDVFQRDQGVGWNFRMFNGSGSTRYMEVTGGPYVVGQWSHLVAVHNASIPSLTLYLNGVQVAQQTVANGTYAAKTVGDLAIGSYSNPARNDLGYENAFTGSMDEVAIYPTALTAGEVLGHYQNGTNASRATPYETLIASHNPAGYWRLDEAPHDPAANSGTAGSVATGVNANTIGFAGPQAPAYAGFDVANRARSFDGAVSYVELGNPAGLNFSGQISVEAWIKPGATPNLEAYILGHGYNDNGTAEDVLRIENNFYTVGSFDGANHGTSYDALADLGGANWVHIVGTYNGIDWNLYRNGVVVATATDATGAVLVNNANWSIGARGRWKSAFGIVAGAAMPDRVFTGGIDEAAIYNYALSPHQIQAHYSVGLYGAHPLTIEKSGADVILTWPAGTLQEADDVLGPYVDIAGSSPLPIPASAARKFYRVRFQ